MSESAVWRLIVRAVVLMVAVVGVVWASTQLVDLILLVLLAMVLACGLGPLVERVERVRLPPTGWTMPPVATVLLLYVVILGVAGVGIWQLAAPVARQADDLVRRAPQFVSDVDRQLELLTGQPGLLAGVNETGTQIASLRAQLGANASRLLGFASSAFGIVTSVVFTLVLALYMTADSGLIREGLLRYLPVEHRAHWRAVSIEAAHRVAGWLIGQVVLSLVIFAVTAVGLLVLGVPYALALAVVAGALEVLPILGPILAGALGVTVAATVDLGLGLKVLLLYVLVQQLENNLLVPRIIGQASGLHPLAVMLVLLVGSSLFGLLGAFLAVPVATAFHVALEMGRATADD